MSHDQTRAARAIISSASPASSVSPASSPSPAPSSRPATRQVITTDQGEIRPAPRYQSAKGCLTISGIMFVCFMLMILFMYLFNEAR